MAAPTRPELPIRWTKRDKERVLLEIFDRKLTEQQAVDKYGLTIEELTEWQRNYELSECHGLKTTHTSRLRRKRRHE